MIDCAKCQEKQTVKDYCDKKGIVVKFLPKRHPELSSNVLNRLLLSEIYHFNEKFFLDGIILRY